MTAELTFLSRLALIGMFLVGLEYLCRTQPQLMAEVAFEIKFALASPFLLLAIVIFWLGGLFHD